MTEHELQKALDLQIQKNMKLTQIIMEMSQKLTEASSVIESLMKKLEERGKE